MRLRDETLLRDRCLIGGEWVGAPASSVIDPSSGATVACVPHLGASEAARSSASACLGDWSRRPAKARSDILRRWYEAIVAAKDDLAQLITAEQGKPLKEALAEIDYAASFVEFYAEEARRIIGEVIPSPDSTTRILVLRQPIGVVAAITPWNFPAAMITRKLAPALAAGCTIVAKPAPETPLTALALAELANRAGLPPGAINVVTGDAEAIGQAWCDDPAVRLLTFTGSTEVGKLLMRQSAATVKKVALELGGNAPFIVFDDADLDAAVAGVLVAKFRNAGQTCVCANRIYVQAGVYDAFAVRLVEKVEALKVADGRDGADIGPLINAAAIAKVERHIDDATRRGAKVLTGGTRLDGNFFTPTVIGGATSEMLLADEETFGPVAPLFRFETEAEVVAAANATPFGLAAYFYTKDLGRSFRVAEALEAGMVGINTALLGTDVAPFGGVKQSGLGREGSRHGIEEYLELKYLRVGGLDAGGPGSETLSHVAA